jgi:hypothetical protein
MNVEIGAEAEQFPEKEYINGIAVAVQISFFNTQSYSAIKGKYGVNNTGGILITVSLTTAVN